MGFALRVIMKRPKPVLPFLLCGNLLLSAFCGLAGEFHATLTDTSTNTWVEDFSVDGGAGKDGDVAWSVRKYTLRGGKQAGVDVVEVNNGKLRFTVVPTRGMNVHELHCGDIRLGWNSPVTELINPLFINPADRGGLGWLDGFNEWMTRCGYEFAGHPGEDDEKMLSLHGKASNLPASKVEVFLKDNRIHVRGRVEEKMFKFVDLEMVTDISTEIGTTSVRFDDTLTNRGSSPQEFEIIYHANYGEPLLEKGSRFIAPVKSVTPFDDRAVEELADYEVYYGPTKGYGETVYCMELNSGKNGRTSVMLHNAAASKGVAMSYNVDSLPFFTLWKNTDVGEKGYVTGLEPGSGFPYNRSVERERGRVKTIAAGKAKHFHVEVDVLPDAAAVKQAAEAISAIQGGKKATVNQQPEQ
ncbi:MAG: DUF4432 domain-containing protein [Roseibacillus sp.]|nr:DUF4432 domain-containing protein [Roseibacillus sp.]HCQ39105.1 DUF4432 domain-containing protein [Verrucomicrobiales bacterium]|tara:strand:+ start:783 stop:2018 length:1236 start_codon:yes stop_codon:yes gene_type:complete